MSEGLRSRVLNAESLSYTEAKLVALEMINHHAECLSFMPNKRWFERVWTRQEALYARRLRIIHASGMSDACTPIVKMNENADKTWLLEFRNIIANTAEFIGTKVNSPDGMTETTGLTSLK